MLHILVISIRFSFFFRGEWSKRGPILCRVSVSRLRTLPPPYLSLSSCHFHSFTHLYLKLSSRLLLYETSAFFLHFLYRALIIFFTNFCLVLVEFISHTSTHTRAWTWIWIHIHMHAITHKHTYIITHWHTNTYTLTYRHTKDRAHESRTPSLYCTTR